MNRKLQLNLIFFALLFYSTIVIAQAVTIERGNYILHFDKRNSSLDSTLYNRMIETFFTVYPKLAERFNHNTASEVTFIVDPAFEGVAATGNDTTIYNARWFEKYPGDIDVVTHEVMHIVQAYPSDSGPWWVTEGIADYVRNKYGVDNEGAKWSMPDLKPEHNYDSSYRITARFFTWLENNVNPTIIDKVDRAMRTKTYSAGIWEKLTGKNIEELWENYKANPKL